MKVRQPQRDEPPTSETREVRCTPSWRPPDLERPTSADELYVVPFRPTDSMLARLGYEEPPTSNKVRAWMDRDALVFRSSATTTLVSLYINGTPSLVLAVVGERCAEQRFTGIADPVELEIELYGVPEDYADLVTIRVCGKGRTKRPETRPVRFKVQLDPELDTDCAIHATRRHGSFTLPGDEVVIPVPAEHDGPVILNFPPYDPAGMGVSFEIDEEGAHLGRVWPDTPAARAGLTEGDRILTVDDQEVLDMTNEDFLSWGLGPEGSEVRLRVLTADGEQEITLKRAYLDL